MTKSKNTFISGLRSAGRVLADVGAAGALWLRDASLGRILGACLLFAFLLAIVPTALVLFVLFLLARALIRAIGKPAAPPQLTYTRIDGD